ncbi:hypothetical protein ACQP3D_30040, partial [Escherichia coli]
LDPESTWPLVYCEEIMAFLNVFVVVVVAVCLVWFFKTGFLCVALEPILALALETRLASNYRDPPSSAPECWD